MGVFGGQMTRGGSLLDVSRRGFLRILSQLMAFIVALKLIPRISFARVVAPDNKPSFNPLPNIENPILRMQQEVREALAKQEDPPDWTMAIDVNRCIGCHACTIACIAENQLPSGMVYLPVLEQQSGHYPTLKQQFFPRPCMQCDNPPCVPVCPVDATYKREDGIVPVDYDRCIGCRACITACPYGARTFDFGEWHTQGTPVSPQPYETAHSPEYNENRSRRNGNSTVGIIRKCHFCIHRVEAGLLPACVTTCISGAITFGPGPNRNQDSLVSQKINQPTHRLKEQLGTEPRVFYVNADNLPS